MVRACQNVYMRKITALLLLLILMVGCTFSRFVFVANHTDEPLDVSFKIRSALLKELNVLKRDTILVTLRQRHFSLFNDTVVVAGGIDSIYHVSVSPKATVFIRADLKQIYDLRFNEEPRDSLPILLTGGAWPWRYVFNWRGYKMVKN